MNKIQKFFRYRQGLIDQYLKGDMTKKEYLEANFDAVYYNDFGPFNRIDTVEKGLYNYQYYNAMAKKMKSISTSPSLDYENKRLYEKRSDSFYKSKDYATLKVLELLDYKGIKAYPISVKSKYLKGRLIEIVIEEYSMILHTANQAIKNRLIYENVFSEEKRKSLIDSYINQKYWHLLLKKIKEAAKICADSADIPEKY